MATPVDEAKPSDEKSGEDHPFKKQKTVDGESDSRSLDLSDYISPRILAKDHQDELQAAFAQARPYPHGVFSNLFRPDFLRQVQTEIKTTSKVNFKESDLFRVYQSIDLANLTEQEHAATLPHVWQLRNVLYSQEWRRWIEQVTGLPPGTLLSSNQVDCACNCHTTGCHLLCHDDGIGTRKVSYILYLTEEEPEWTEKEGGALELYDSVPVKETKKEDTSSDRQQRIPLSVPSATLLPLFNHMAFFVVEPGVSFHAVQEVLGDRPRLSLQGWYHAARAPDNLKAATLSRLKKTMDGQGGGDAEETETDFQPCSYPEQQQEQASSDNLSEEDRAYLSKYLHATYLTPNALQQIRERFEEDSSVQLRNFLREPWAEQLRLAITQADQPKDDASSYQQGTSDSWKLIGPAHKQRFLEYTPTSTTRDGDKDKSKDSPPQTMGELLQQIRTELLESVPFWRFLGLITSLGLPTKSRGRIRRFRRGLDYTVAHYGLLMDKSVLDATLCFVAGKGEEVAAEDDDQVDVGAPEPDEADAMWQSGDVGAFECYIEADDDDNGEAADEYNQDDDTELLSVSASFNTLSLVYRDPGTMRFIKYIGSRAPSSRFDVAMEYEVPDADEEEEDKESQDSKLVQKT